MPAHLSIRSRMGRTSRINPAGRRPAGATASVKGRLDAQIPASPEASYTQTEPGPASARPAAVRPQAAHSDSPATGSPTLIVTLARIAWVILSASSGFSLSAALAASRPWPTSTPS